MHTAKSKFSLIKNICDIHIHNSLSNVAIHMLYVAQDITNWKWFSCVSLPLIAMGISILHVSDYISCLCSKINRYT